MKTPLILAGLLAVAASASATVTFTTDTIGTGGAFSAGTLTPQNAPGPYVGSSYSATGSGLTITGAGAGTTTWTNKFNSSGLINAVTLTLSGTITGTPATALKITLNSFNVYDEGANGSPSVFDLPTSPAITQTYGTGAFSFTRTFVLSHAITLGRISMGDLFQIKNGSVTLNTVTTTAVPEPASLAALGLGAIGLLRRRRKA